MQLELLVRLTGLYFGRVCTNYPSIVCGVHMYASVKLNEVIDAFSVSMELVLWAYKLVSLGPVLS